MILLLLIVNIEFPSCTQDSANSFRVTAQSLLPTLPISAFATTVVLLLVYLWKTKFSQKVVGLYYVFPLG
jgi:hypothetical protein